MIVANDVSESSADEPDIGFNSDYNALHVFWSSKGQLEGEQQFELARKSLLARKLITLIANRYRDNTQHAKDTA